VSVSQVDIMCLMANIRRAGGGWRGGGNPVVSCRTGQRVCEIYRRTPAV
jgi:hypothetical protein